MGCFPGPESPEADKVFLKSYGCMNESIAGRGVYKVLTRLSEILAYEDGFDYILAENSVPGT